MIPVTRILRGGGRRASRRIGVERPSLEQRLGIGHRPPEGNKRQEDHTARKADESGLSLGEREIFPKRMRGIRIGETVDVRNRKQGKDDYGIGEGNS